MTAASPILYSRVGNGPHLVADVRTLPENVKVAIIMAAIEVSIFYGNGEYGEAPDAAEDAIGALSDAVSAIDPHMHPLPIPGDAS